MLLKFKGERRNYCEKVRKIFLKSVKVQWKRYNFNNKLEKKSENSIRVQGNFVKDLGKI